MIKKEEQIHRVQKMLDKGITLEDINEQLKNEEILRSRLSKLIKYPDHAQYALVSLKDMYDMRKNKIKDVDQRLNLMTKSKNKLSDEDIESMMDKLTPDQIKVMNHAIRDTDDPDYMRLTMRKRKTTPKPKRKPIKCSCKKK